MQDATIEMARQMLDQARYPNIVQARVEVEELGRRRGRWQPLVEAEDLRFPQMGFEELKSFTFGIFQINLAPGYIQDNLIDTRQAEFQYDQDSEAGFIRIRFYSRYRGGTRHQLWIAYDDEPLEEDDFILGTYCTCQTGARTLGTCAHVAAVLWNQGYAKNPINHVKYPPTIVLDEVLDVRNVQ
uniref:SWIM-type domain-containing protein n=1 Tax=Cacopsylla melanoneura TaxID=428564 RepID=A0A8D9FCI8_9HEMI